MTTFDELLEGAALKAAKSLYKSPTPIQKKVIPIVLAKHDVVAMSKTGSGKTASFLFPLIQMLEEHSKITGCRALILSPTRELSLQTAKFFRQYTTTGQSNLKYAALIGGEPLPPQFDALTTNPDVIIATPGRLLHIIAETQYSLSRVECLIIDEADQMFDQGLSVQLTAILQILNNEHQTLLFSATIPQLLAEFTQVHLGRAIVVRLDTTKLPEQLRTEFYLVPPPFKDALTIYTVHRFENAMIFVGTRQRAEYLSALFSDLGIRSGCIYGDMDQDERSSSLAAFSRKSLKILFVTDVAARGLDVEGLDLVLNYDFPAKPKLFLHRSGRAGRAGRAGHVVSFVTEDELPYYAGAVDSLNGHDWIITRVSSAMIEDEITRVDDTLRRNSDIQYLKVGALDSEKLYIKSRPQAKPLWLSLAKELDIKATSDIQARLNEYRPKSTIFEQFPSSQAQVEIMQSIRNAHAGHTKILSKSKTDILSNNPSNVNNNVNNNGNDQTNDQVNDQINDKSNDQDNTNLQVNEKPKRKERVAKPREIKEEKKSKYFIEYRPAEGDAAQVRDNTVGSLLDKVLDMTPDDRSGLIAQKSHKKKWDKGNKKEKVIKEMITGQSAFIRHAVKQIEGVNPKGEKYQEWASREQKHIQAPGEEERIFKTKKGKFGSSRKQEKIKDELKTPKQIERERLEKEKHRLHDLKRHKEAAEINKKLRKLGK